MLVLSRAKGEGILVGETVLIVVTAIHAHDVRIGIQAPHDVPIHRSEVVERIIANGGRLNEQGELIERSRQDLMAEIQSLKGQLALATKR